MVNKTGGESVVMKKGRMKGYADRAQGTSMDVRPSTPYEGWASKVDSHDKKKKSQNRSPEAVDQG